MNSVFSAHNTHLQGLDFFQKQDPHLRQLYRQKHVFLPHEINEIPQDTPGIYSLVGGRQIGKSTLIKQWMLMLLKQGVPSDNIFFMSGELIDDHHKLVHLLQDSLVNKKRTKIILPNDTSEEITHQLQYRIIDEVTYIKEWDKGIKYLADSGVLENVVLVLSGSDSSLIYEAMKRFPGRRGRARQVDFHYYPLNFRQFIKLMEYPVESPSPEVERRNWLQGLMDLFDRYLLHGGYLTAINDYSRECQIADSTYQTYSDWVRGDFLKRRKSETYLRAVLFGIMKRYASQVSWINLSKELPIDHHQTVIDYVDLLKTMDVAIVQEALIEDKLMPAPKKAKKIYFFDPFIYRALHSWLEAPVEINKSLLVEGVVVSHFMRKYPTYYIKAEGEVDIAYIPPRAKVRVNNLKQQPGFVPIEIKWTQQILDKDLKQIKKYVNGEVWGRELNQQSLFLPEQLLSV